MQDQLSALYSTYIIDGVQQDFSPASMLDSIVYGASPRDALKEDDVEIIVDESVDPIVHRFDCPSDDPLALLSELKGFESVFPLAYSDVCTRNAIATKLIDVLWQRGSFRLGNLLLDIKWLWNEGPLGSMASFYNSVQNAADYIDALGLGIFSYGYSLSQTASSFSTELRISPEIEEDAFLDLQRALPSKLIADKRSWLIYMPFDTSEYRLGGSQFAQMMGLGGAAPCICDADYFMDCHEVVREFVEDGILLSAVTVGKGGLIAAADKMLSSDVGIELNISDLLNSVQEENPVNLLFSEVPGVLLQIRDNDFDYLDAELLLQDVAYFPLGHPDSSGKLKISVLAKTGIQTIIESLMLNAEGED